MTPDTEDWLVAIAAFLLAAGLALSLIAATAHLSFPGKLAQIEQLRADVRRVDVAASEDVIGQVTMANQSIKQAQTYNSLWWADWALPDAWNDVAIIELP